MRRLQQFKQKRLRTQEEETAREESQVEKIAKIRAALKLLERHRKKQQYGVLQEQSAGPSAQTRPPVPSGQLARLFPGYSEEDIDEALSLLEAERRRKELLALQEAERKARKRHPRHALTRLPSGETSPFPTGEEAFGPRAARPFEWVGRMLRAETPSVPTTPLNIVWLRIGCRGRMIWGNRGLHLVCICLLLDGMPWRP